MKCPFCSHVDDKVVDSRESKEGEVIRRRRECLSPVPHCNSSRVACRRSRYRVQRSSRCGLTMNSCQRNHVNYHRRAYFDCLILTRLRNC